MGIQPVRDVDLIRHAYVPPGSQRRGVGGALLEHLARSTTRRMLVGTWAAAEWAIRFYRRHGFELVSPERKTELLGTYWTIPERQIETSVVLAKPAVRRAVTFTASHRGRLRPAAGVHPRLRRHVAHLGVWSCRRSSAITTSSPSRWPGTPAARRSRARSTTPCSPTRSRRAMDEAGFETAHIVGNSLGGYVALQLAARGRARHRGRARSGRRLGDGDESYKDTLGVPRRCTTWRKAAAPHAEAILATPEGRRRATELITDELRAHPGRADRPPVARGGRLRRRARR